MKNVKTMYRKLTMMVVLGVLLAVMSCNNLLTPPKGNSTDRDSGSCNVSEDGKVLITIKLFTGSARMVMPDIDIAQLTWSITAEQEQGNVSIPATGTYPTYSLELPTTGNWTFTVKGTESDVELFTGTVTENVSNSTVSISIPLSPGSGMTDGGATGNLDLTIKPEDVLTMTLKYRVDGGDWCTCITSSGLDPDQGEYWTPYYITESNLSVGQHTLDLYFGGGSKFYFCTVAVNIWPGKTSARWIKTSGEEYINDNGEFVITEEMVNKFVKTMGSVVFVDATVNADEPATGSIFAPVKTVSTAVDILRKANPDGNYKGTIMVSGATTITNEVQVQSRETLTVKGTGEDASITNDKGRVFTVESGGSLTLEENITLTGTNDTGNGGAVYVNGGNFIMKAGSKITGSRAQNGGGVYIAGGTFTMNGTAILQGNMATTHGGGVHIFSGGTFTMNGGTIDGTAANTATLNGGGVFVSGGTFNMNDGTISGNTVTQSGGGVYVNDGNFTMKGGTIGGATANTAEYGGGVCVYKGDFTMSDGSISGNTATDSGGGVYVDSGTFTVSGSPNISGNGFDDLNNVYLTSGKIISIGAGGLTETARIGVTTATSPAAGTEVRITDTAVDGAESIFIPDAEGCIIMSKEDAVYLADSSSFEVSWDTGSGVQYGSFADGVSALNTSGSGGTITLQKNIDDTNAVFSSDGGTTANDQPITFSGGAEASPVILDLNGCTIDRGLGTAQADGTVISVSGALTLKDSTGSGKITGGNNNNSTISGTWGGGVCVRGGAFFTMEGGNISYNFSEIGGGGVYVCNGGSFTMTGGTIGGSGVNDGNMNTSTSYGGGGVFVNGEFTMSGGTITGNSTDANGGGVAVTADGTFTMSGTAVISDNEASNGSGGGVYSAADFTMTGGTISSNTATDGGGVYMINSKKITMDGGAISGNTATTNGGGLYLYDGSTAEIGKNTSGSAPQISNNAATNDGTAHNAGGGIYLAASSSVEFTRGTIRSNTVGEGTGSTSSQGGGVYIGSGSTFIMDGESAIIENNKINSVIGAGGGVCVVGGELTMSAGSITGNNAGSSGGGVYVDGGSSNFTMTDGEISGNYASSGGGVTVGSAGTFTISSPAVVSGNTISSVGGENVYVISGGKFIDNDNCVTEGVEEQQ